MDECNVKNLKKQLDMDKIARIRVKMHLKSTEATISVNVPLGKLVHLVQKKG